MTMSSRSTRWEDTPGTRSKVTHSSVVAFADSISGIAKTTSESGTPPYIYMQLPGPNKVRLLLTPTRTSSVPMNFGREAVVGQVDLLHILLALLRRIRFVSQVKCMGLPTERLEWRSCQQSTEEETELARKLKISFETAKRH